MDVYRKSIRSEGPSEFLVLAKTFVSASHRSWVEVDSMYISFNLGFYR
jgi:hypothetical protein